MASMVSIYYFKQQTLWLFALSRVFNRLVQLIFMQYFHDDMNLMLPGILFCGQCECNM